jgi:hypothetical protein
VEFPDKSGQAVKVFPGTKTVLARSRAVHQGQGMVDRGNPVSQEVLFRFPQGRSQNP